MRRNNPERVEKSGGLFSVRTAQKKRGRIEFAPPAKKKGLEREGEPEHPGPEDLKKKRTG